MAVERGQVLIGGAVGVVVILAVWGLWSSTPVTGSPPARSSAAARGKVAAGAETPGPMAPVRLGSLRASREERAEPGEAARNPFRFQPRVEPPPVTQQPVFEAPPTPAPRPGPPPLPPIPLKLQGVIERANGVKWAVLTDGKSGPMYGKDGDIIDGRYLIVKIGTESIEMAHADGRGRQLIRLTGQ